MARWLLVVLVSVLATPGGSALAQPTSWVQFVHNAADPDVEAIDVYVNGERVVDDLAFREATSFIEVPSGEELHVVVAPGGSTDGEDGLSAFPMSFQADHEYVAVANGVLYPARFAPNPSGASIDFRLFVQDHARLRSTQATCVQLFAVHGVTDLGAVYLSRGRGDVLLDDLAYGDVTGYLSLDPLMYVLRFVDDADRDQVVARALARLRSLRGGAGALVTSGFADPAANQDGPGLALLLVAPSGDVVELPLWRPR